MTSRILKILAIVAVTALVAGCKLEVVSVQGGDIGWNGGSCPERNNCVVQITDPNYSSNFTVTPKPGYEFVKWQNAAGFLCGNSISLTCTVTMPADANVAAAIIGLFATGHIMPIYKDVGIDTDLDTIRNELDTDDDNDGVLDVDDACPFVGPNLDGFGCPVPPIDESDTITVEGRVWAQPNLFLNTTSSEIIAACPGGICNGTLKGFVMTGWTWASLLDVANLFDYYKDPVVDDLCPAVERFYVDGWRPWSIFITAPPYTSAVFGTGLDGLVYNVILNDTKKALIGTFPGMPGDCIIAAGFGFDTGPHGAWFYRTP